MIESQEWCGGVTIISRMHPCDGERAMLCGVVNNNVYAMARVEHFCGVEGAVYLHIPA